MGDQEFNPDWVSAPGDTIADILEERGIPVEELAQRIGKSQIGAQALLEGRTPLTLDIAIMLSRWLGGSPEFWMTREAQYREGEKEK